MSTFLNFKRIDDTHSFNATTNVKGFQLGIFQKYFLKTSGRMDLGRKNTSSIGNKRWHTLSQLESTTFIYLQLFRRQ